MNIFLLFIAALTLAQCKEIPLLAPVAPESVESRADEDSLTEADFTLGAQMTYGNAMPQGIAIESANANISGNAMLFEGDIMLSGDERAIVDRGISSEIEEMRSAQTSRKWPRSKGDNIEVIVPYTIKTGFTDAEKALIAAGIDQYHKNTCIK